ncbi:methylated-DNA--[protein]-cysteine S-methyltransferase [Anaerorhabdus sp.]|jgi:methylated-DNA-[protein]-cysteine S-methyltransferase|uniref:methylated-DNA--[protein]-cysteine S-methyltransferase n=1 Tax=Anaerorhabdus sp. TaxID=1872524 RepID=UPI002FC6C2B3
MKQRTVKTKLANIECIENDGFLIELNFVDDSIKKSDQSPLLDQVEKELLEYLDGVRKVFSVPIKLKGTEFQMDVLRAMQTIPYGEVRSYKDLAIMINRPKAARAVGNACNKNPIAIIVPCHRVIASNHKLGGYGYGVDSKIRLLKIENSEC